MTEQHDEALVERVALAMARTVDMEIPDDWANYSMSRDFYTDKARAIIYPPAPPKTRLQVAADIWREAGGKGQLIHDTVAGKAILAALALPAMED